MAQYRRPGAVSPQVSCHNRVSGLLQVLRKRLVPVLVFLHSVDTLHNSLGCLSLINPQGQRVPVTGRQDHFLKAHCYFASFPCFG